MRAMVSSAMPHPDLWLWPPGQWGNCGDCTGQPQETQDNRCPPSALGSKDTPLLRHQGPCSQVSRTKHGFHDDIKLGSAWCQCSLPETPDARGHRQHHHACFLGLAGPTTADNGFQSYGGLSASLIASQRTHRSKFIIWRKSFFFLCTHTKKLVSLWVVNPRRRWNIQVADQETRRQLEP